VHVNVVPMNSTQIDRLPRTIAYARFGYAALSLFAPKAAASALGVKRREMTPAAIAWASVFASREAALGAFSLISENLDTKGRRRTLLLNAAVDTVDSLALIALARRHRQFLPLFVALPPGLFSALAHIQAAREVGLSEGTAA
jgi:hypothetical protein